MKEVRDILLILARIAIEFGHRLRIIYIPEKDAMPWPFDLEKEESIQVGESYLPEGLRSMQYGEDTPEKAAKSIQIVEKETAPGEWEIFRFDGVAGTPNFRDWHKTDDAVIARRKYTEKTVQNYLKVRPLVIDGRTNTEIAAALGMSDRTVDQYAGAVREAFRARMKEQNNPSPTGERGEQDAEAPQIAANISEPA
jgi:hypothetical protein